MKFLTKRFSKFASISTSSFGSIQCCFTVLFFVANYVFAVLSTVNRISTSSNNKLDEDNSTLSLRLPPLSFPVGSEITVNAVTTALSNFKNAKLYYRQRVLEGNHELPRIYGASSSVDNVFRQIFPELVKSRGITMVQQKDINGDLFRRWEEGYNEVIIELDDRGDSSSQTGEKSTANSKRLDAVFIGGPSTLTACLLYQLRYPDHSVQHLFADRYDSNYDGSAYYYHQRDAAPVYINRVNRGLYCIYIDLYKRLISSAKLAYLAETDRHHIKISLNWANIKLRQIFTIFVPNVWHTVTDLWIKKKQNAKIAHVIEHACRTVPIVYAISNLTKTPVETMLIRGKNKANYVSFVGSISDPKEHFTWLNKFAHVPFYEISCEGFGTDVTQVLNFPNDGLIAPMIIENLQKQIANRAKLTQPDATYEISRKSSQLKKLFVQPGPSDCSTRMRVTSIEWIDTITGISHQTTADRIFISLGPSGQIKIKPPSLTLMHHAVEIIRQKSISRSIKVDGGYKLTLWSFWRHTLNTILNQFFRGSYCLKDSMWASGSSSIILLGVDLNNTKSAQLDVFSRFIDSVNQHWTLIAQRDVSLPLTASVDSPMKSYRFYAIQMTGGGNFPSRLIRPDFVLNLLHTTEKMYGLDGTKHAVYDLVQSRGCGRAVSAQNTIAFQNLADNAVVSYALGGIGMTTMFSNGERMIQMIEKNDKRLKKICNNISLTNHFLGGIDYSFMTGKTQHLARFLGFDNSMSKEEKQVVVGSAIAVTLSVITTVWLCIG